MGVSRTCLPGNEVHEPRDERKDRGSSNKHWMLSNSHQSRRMGVIDVVAPIFFIHYERTKDGRRTDDQGHCALRRLPQSQDDPGDENRTGEVAKGSIRPRRLSEFVEGRQRDVRLSDVLRVLGQGLPKS